MKKLLIILMITICAGCEIPPEHFLELHNHGYTVDMVNYYADGNVLVERYHLWRECDTCELLPVIETIHFDWEILYGQDSYFKGLPECYYLITLSPYDSLNIEKGQWSTYIKKGNKNKHQTVILDILNSIKHYENNRR